MISGGRSRFRMTHRWAGRLVVLITVFLVAPSGVVMSTQAFSGPIAGMGFASLALATAGAASAAFYFARRRNFLRHQKWATRCFYFVVFAISVAANDRGGLCDGCRVDFNLSTERLVKLAGPISGL